MTGLNEKERVYTWDVLKCILIVLVIFGHWLEYGLSHSANLIAYNFIYLFHMPFFIFISGYFSSKKDSKRFRKDMLRLFETYIVAQTLYVVSSYYLQHKPLTWHYLYEPNAAAWYLLSLVSWRFVLQIIPSSWLKCKWLIPLSVLVGLSAGFMPVGNELSLQRTFAFLPFFLCGYVLKGKIKFDNSLKNSLVCIAVVVVSWIIACVLLNRDISFVTYCNQDYHTSTTQYSARSLVLLRALFYLSACLLIYSMLRLIPKIEKSSFFGRMGEDTLFYYVYHIIVIRIGIIVIRSLQLPLVFPAMLLYVLLSIALLYFLGKVSVFRKMLNPISSIIRK